MPAGPAGISVMCSFCSNVTELSSSVSKLTISMTISLWFSSLVEYCLKTNI